MTESRGQAHQTDKASARPRILEAEPDLSLERARSGLIDDLTERVPIRIVETVTRAGRLIRQADRIGRSRVIEDICRVEAKLNGFRFGNLECLAHVCIEGPSRQCVQGERPRLP